MGVDRPASDPLSDVALFVEVYGFGLGGHVARVKSGGKVDVTKFLSFGDVINAVVSEEAYPFQREPEDGKSNLLQGRVLFADEVGLHLESNGSLCMPSFEEDSIDIESLDVNKGTFFPWSSVVSVVKVVDSDGYEARILQHQRDEEAFYSANGSYPESNGEFSKWRNSLSQAEYDAAYNAPLPD